MKYLTFESDNITRRPGMLLFPSYLTHKDVADSLGKLVISAGFVNWVDQSCHGSSVSINKPARLPHDTILLRAIMAAEQGETVHPSVEGGHHG